MQEYINSGILEAYVMGAASEEEVKELMFLKTKYPEVNNALQALEMDMEKIAVHMAITPPPNVWDRIENDINALILSPEKEVEVFTPKTDYNQAKTEKPENDYIQVEGESSHMRIHKNWKWVFAAVFILGKIFLGCAIYFYLENRQSQEQLQELKTEMRQLKK